MTPAPFVLRVYYEDTDVGGVVYYANYFKYFERARTEWLRALGFSNTALKDDFDRLIVVHRAEIDFKSPARLEDEIRILTKVVDIGACDLILEQKGVRGDAHLCNLVIRLACVGLDGRPARWPAPLKDAIQTLRVTNETP